MLISIAWSLHLRKERWICKNSFLSWHFYRSSQWAKFFAYFLFLGLCQLAHKVWARSLHLFWTRSIQRCWAPIRTAVLGPIRTAVLGPIHTAVLGPIHTVILSLIGTMVLSPIRTAVLGLICTAVFDPIYTAVLGPISTAVLGPIRTAVLTCIEHKETDKRPKYLKRCLISNFTCDLLIGMLTTGSSGSGLPHLIQYEYVIFFLEAPMILQ